MRVYVMLFDTAEKYANYLNRQTDDLEIVSVLTFGNQIVLTYGFRRAF